MAGAPHGVRWAPLGAGLLVATLAAGGAWAWIAYQQKQPSTPSAEAPPRPAKRGASASPARATSDWALARFCPATAVAFAGVRDLPGAGARLDKTDLGKLLASPGVRTLASQGLGLLRLPSKGGKGTPLPVQAFLARLRGAGLRDAAVALTEIEFPEHCRPIPHILVALSAGRDGTGPLEALARDAFAALAADEPGLKHRERDHDAVTRIHLLGDAEVSLAYALRGDTLLLASHEATLVAALDQEKGKDLSLQGLLAFQELSAEMDNRDALAFISLAPLWDRLTPEERRQAAPSGLLEVDAVAAGVEVSPPGFHEVLALHTAKSRKGLLEMLDNPPVPRSALVAPANLQSFTRVNLAPGRAWDLVMKTLQQSLAPAQYNDVLKGLDDANRALGVRLREDLLQDLGEAVTVVQTPGTDPLHPDFIMSWALSDAEHFTGAFKKLMASVLREGSPLQRLWLGDAEVFTLDPRAMAAAQALRGLETVPALAFGLRANALVIASRPDLVAAFGTKPPPDPKENPVFAQAMAAVPARAWAVAYTDLRSLVTESLAVQAPRLAAQGLALPPVLQALVNAGTLPGLDTPLATSPIVASVYATPRCVVVDCRSPLPLSSVTLAAVAVGVAALSQPGMPAFPAAP